MKRHNLAQKLALIPLNMILSDRIRPLMHLYGKSSFQKDDPCISSKGAEW